MKILAIDATLRNTACVLMDDGKLVNAWFISTKPDKDRWETTSEKDQRDVVDWVRGIRAIVKDAKPDFVCAEQFLGATQSATATKQLALIAGAMYTMATFAEEGAVWLFTRVYEAKRAAVGRKQATKNEMIDAMLKRFPELGKYILSEKTGKPIGKAEHYADACANYLACLELPSIKLLQQKERK